MTIAEFALFAGHVRVAGDDKLRNRWSATDGFVIEWEGREVYVCRKGSDGKTVFALASGWVTMAPGGEAPYTEAPYTEAERRRLLREERLRASGFEEVSEEQRRRNLEENVAAVHPWEEGIRQGLEAIAATAVVCDENRRPLAVPNGKHGQPFNLGHEHTEQLQAELNAPRKPGRPRGGK